MLQIKTDVVYAHRKLKEGHCKEATQTGARCTIDLEEILHHIHDTSLNVSLAMTVCAHYHGHNKPTLWHHSAADEKQWLNTPVEDGDSQVALICVNELEATFMALNNTCHDLAEDIDECETRESDLSETCVTHVRATKQELIHAEQDVIAAIKHCKSHPHDNLKIEELLKSTGLEDELSEEELWSDDGVADEL